MNLLGLDVNHTDHVWCTSWLESKFLVKTFEDDKSDREFSVKGTRQLIDVDSSETVAITDSDGAE